MANRLGSCPRVRVLALRRPSARRFAGAARSPADKSGRKDFLSGSNGAGPATAAQQIQHHLCGTLAHLAGRLYDDGCRWNELFGPGEVVEADQRDVVGHTPTRLCKGPQRAIEQNFVGAENCIGVSVTPTKFAPTAKYCFRFDGRLSSPIVSFVLQWGDSNAVRQVSSSGKRLPGR